MFTYLSDMPTPASLVLGDARLTLRSVRDGAHDLLIMDAFSSDSPPAHLLTVEAMADAMRTVAPGGLLAVHVSNRYYDLAPAIAGAADDLGLISLQHGFAPSSVSDTRLLAMPSIWVVVARRSADVTTLAARGWGSIKREPALTDDNPDLMRLLRAWR